MLTFSLRYLYMKKLINNYNFTDILLTTFLSLVLTIITYFLLCNVYPYSSLNDFYVGPSIYSGYNKNFDIYIYFIYLLFFFIFINLILFIKQKIKINRKNKEVNENKTNEKNTHSTINKIKYFLLKYQLIGVLGFIFLHPFNKEIYPILILIIAFLILISVYDVLKISQKENNPKFSVLIITSIIFAILVNTYNVSYVPTDDHHFGEKFATFFLHNNFNMEYYKDIMLVHGYIDVIPSWIGCYIFRENNVYGYCLGEILFRNLLLIATILSGLVIFKKNKLFIAPLLFFNANNITVFYATTILLLIQDNILKRRYIWLCIFSIISFLFCMTWTTIGTFWLISSIPIIIYQVLKIQENEDEKKLIKIIMSLLPLVLLLICSHSSIIEYIKEAPEYIKGNFWAFGNSYGEFTLYISRLLVYTYKLFALIFLPILLLELIKQIKNKGNINSILFLLFTIILPIISLSYTLGRTDFGCFYRIEFISQAYLLVFLPYFLYKFSSKKYNHFLLFIMICILLLSLFNFSSKFKSPQINKREYYLNNVGKIALKEDYAKRVENVNRFVEMNSDSDSVFPDLTNRGMHYLYLNKKIPIKFVSFYNVISTKQSVEITEKLKRNPPDIILIDSDSIFHDNVHLSLRINSLYKWLLLLKKYKIVIDKGNTFLIKNDEIKNYEKQDLHILDNILGFRNLNYLPEVWGNSINKLPLNNLIIDYYSYIEDEQYIIKFKHPISGDIFDFLYIEPISNSNKNQNFYIQINNSDSEIFCKVKRNGKMLIPFDNYPSWLLNDKIEEIQIYSNKNFKGEYIIKFYKRKCKKYI